MCLFNTFSVSRENAALCVDRQTDRQTDDLTARLTADRSTAPPSEGKTVFKTARALS